MKLTIVTTLYYSAPYIIEFYKRASAAAKQLVKDDYEIILVNDGSPDNSLDLAVQLTESDDHIVVVDLSRNFGHHKAMMTGLSQAKGDAIFLIDSDLEEDPEWLIDFSIQMKDELCDVVYGVQGKRKGGLFERWSGHVFYKLFRELTRLNIPDNIITARLMSRRYVDALLLHEEREVLILGLWHITGFLQCPQIINKHSREGTTYTLLHKLSVLINSVTSFSNVPLVGIFYIGILISSLAAVYIAYLVTNWFFLANPQEGWTSVIASVWFIGGLIISFIGVIGIYLAKIFSETKRRPYTIVRQIYGDRKNKATN